VYLIVCRYLNFVPALTPAVWLLNLDVCFQDKVLSWTAQTLASTT